jgi:hypothetical protein
MRYTLQISFLALILIFVSCGSNGGKNRKGKMIPTKEVVSILTDLYLSDGILAFPPVRSKFSVKDSIANYIEVIEKHGYTKNQMDNTMHYYFVKDPKKLAKIYDEVLAKLSEIQTKLETEIPPAETHDYQLWNEKTSFSLPEAGLTNPIWFNVPVKDTGLYEMSFAALVFTDDQSTNPRTEIFFWHADGSKEGVRDYWNKVPLTPDGIRHTYSIRKRLTDTSFTHISGWLFNHDPQLGRWEKHARITDIILMKAKFE